MTKIKRVSDTRLKAYLDAVKNDSLLLGHVDRHIQKIVSTRDTTVIHPSEMAMADWCPRATWLRLTGVSVKKDPVTLRSGLIFDTGHAIHDKWQSWLRDMGVLWGKWQCQICDSTLLAYSDEIGGLCPGRSSAASKHIWSYKEVPLSLPSHRIAGHADGLVNPSFDEPLLLEIKSIGPGTMRSLDLLGEDEGDHLSSDRFSRITRPASAHFRQVQIYLRLIEEYELQVGPVRRAVVVYEHKADQQVREFVITRDDKWTDPLFESALDIVWAIDKGREVRCPVGGCKRCRTEE